MPENATLLLDTSCLAAYLGHEPTSAVAALVVDGFIRSGRNRAVVSVVTAAELLVRPLRVGARDVERAILELLRTFPNLEIVNVDLTIARLAAEIRALTGLRAPDALILASGFDRGAQLALSDDAGWPERLTHEAAMMNVVALRALA